MSDNVLEQERLALGIELGSTRVKAVLVDERGVSLAGGSHEWRSNLVDGHWTYGLDEVWQAVQGAVAGLRADFESRHGAALNRVGAVGVSAMMHGYLAFDEAGELLTPLRTWQDTTTAEAAQVLSQLFNINIPMRWSVAHLYQAILDEEAHVPEIAFCTTLAGYVHWQLCGEKVLGVGDASGMVPIDPATGSYDQTRLDSFSGLVAERALPWKLGDILPKVLNAGQNAGTLTAEGAALLDPSGQLQPGAVMAPPEGDAGTGMVATNTIRPATANISAGTSIFAMVVLEEQLQAMHEELDPVTTPDGKPVVMVHCNNGAADLQDWVMLFGEAAQLLGAEFDTDTLFSTLYEKSLEGSVDAEGMVAFNFRAGEPIAAVEEGRPLFVRMPEHRLQLADFMRAHLYGSFAVLRLGFEVLHSENVRVDEIFAHGGLFRTKGVAQRFLSAALDVPVTVSETASEGGAWGMALLAAHALQGGGDLAGWLDEEIFAGDERSALTATPEEVAGFDAYMDRYRSALAIQRAAVDALQR